MLVKERVHSESIYPLWPRQLIIPILPRFPTLKSAWWSRSPKKINHSFLIYHHRDILKLASKSTNNLLSNGPIAIGQLAWWSEPLPKSYYLPPVFENGGRFVLGSVAVSADVLLYISVAIKASFLKLGMRNICKNNIAKMFLDFFKM